MFYKNNFVKQKKYFFFWVKQIKNFRPIDAIALKDDIYKKCIVEYEVIVTWCIMKHSKELFSSVVDDVLLPQRIILYYVS